MTTTTPVMTAQGAGTAASLPLIPLKGLRGSIARNMTAGWQAPRVAMGVDVDMSHCLALRVALQAQLGPTPRLTVTPIVLRAVALTLREHPRMNALMREGGIEPVTNVNIALAVSLDEGLTAPVIRDADTKSIRELADESRELALAARAGKLPPKAYQGGTFTVSNLGMTGINWFTPILNPPQVGILGMARVVETPVVRGGQIVIMPITILTLVFDHRAVDGYPAALFLDGLRKRLESGRDL